MIDKNFEKQTNSHHQIQFQQQQPIQFQKSQMNNNVSPIENQYNESGIQQYDSSNPNKSTPVQNISYQIYTPYISPTVYQYPNIMYQQQLQYQFQNSSIHPQSYESPMAQPVTAVFPCPQFYNSYPTVIPPQNITPSNYQLCMLQTSISQPVQNSCVNYQSHIDIQNQQKIVENSDIHNKEKCKNENNIPTTIKIEGSQTTELPISSTVSIQIQNLEQQSKNFESNNYFKSYSEQVIQDSDMKSSEIHRKCQTQNKYHYQKQNDFKTQEKQCQYKNNLSNRTQNTTHDKQTVFVSPKKIKKIKSSNIKLNLPDKKQILQVKGLKCNKFISKKENLNKLSQQLQQNQDQKDINLQQNINRQSFSKYEEQIQTINQKPQNEKFQKQLSQNISQIKQESNIESNQEISIDFDDIQSVSMDEQHQKISQNQEILIKNSHQQNQYNQLITKNEKLTENKNSSEQSSPNQSSLKLETKNLNRQEKTVDKDIFQDHLKKINNFENDGKQLNQQNQQNQTQQNNSQFNQQNIYQSEITQQTNKKQQNIDNKKQQLNQQIIKNNTKDDKEQLYPDNKDNDNKENSEQYSNINEYMKKGNCVKNIIKAFQNWCKDGIQDDVLISQCPHYVEEGLNADQIRKKLNRYTKKKVPNHQNLQSLVEHDKFKPALDWISSSYIKNKDQHFQFVKLLIEKWDNQVFFDGFMKVLKRKKNLKVNNNQQKDKYYCQETLE